MQGTPTATVHMFDRLLKAFDCVSHDKLWKTMERMGFPKHLIDLVSKLYQDQESAVKTSGGDTEWLKCVKDAYCHQVS